MVVTMHIAMLTSIAKLCAVVVAVVVLGGEEEEVVVHDRGSTWVEMAWSWRRALFGDSQPIVPLPNHQQQAGSRYAASALFTVLPPSPTLPPWPFVFRQTTTSLMFLSQRHDSPRPQALP